MGIQRMPARLEAATRQLIEVMAVTECYNIIPTSVQRHTTVFHRLPILISQEGEDVEVVVAQEDVEDADEVQLKRMGLASG